MFGCGIDVSLICLLSFSDTVRHLFGASVVITGHNFQQTHNNEMAEAVTKDFGRIDIFVHSLANGPEVTKPLLETSRRGFLATISALSYSFVSLLRHFLPIMNPCFFRFHENKTIACSICVYIST
ncbi:enoyl-[acyl-carrier-protein] reductase [NADH] 1, chloroplastic-like [Zingiber officinale]|uniref:enoyl-[acyl-carrier-protein] reductase [NADH] 1, chloroplastic-like n=1 Tax=Zingiber officinale TaxID=94328 RepID=UPI001C4AA8E0|nr:enoyl-[acyl-carrier-protein] reductase [NADH] 1, chloroplastic-like [Zingiber officinale]